MAKNDFAEDIDPTPKTITAIVDILKTASNWRAYAFEKRVIIQVWDYEEQNPYLLLMEKTKFDAVTCLLNGHNCGGD